ncbi:lipocalin-like domain-containing protein [Antarcticimicrobium sediminis]|uniref:Iron ABC transporter permease n=1 Tax=Antarcticimicrobium sediminis TaxID=2546227 RepID=A0A4R5EU07_9RHOB|nr:lipocalin-like domain-containing protein [Antarcticimicrobium sediminis]TDE38304.1 iron ABC transporter permease [Antarcticimicrobium sediminis]
MLARLVVILALALLAARPAGAQGFAGLGSTAAAEGFATPSPDTRLSFPRDHGPHPDFRIEWWYLTANLTGPDGTDYGVQWTLFRTALALGEAEGWASPQIWMGHAAATTPQHHYFAERLARGGIGQAGVHSDPFEAWIDGWQMAGEDFDSLRLTARGAEFAYDLTLSAEGPLVLQGVNGYSVKSADGQASHYYSQPHYRIEGTLTLPSGPVAVSGQGWLDREWSSQPLAADQTGWDWFSLSFDSGAHLMGFRLRGARGDFTSGTWIAPDGSATPLAPGAFQAAPLELADVAGRQIPIRWRVTLPERGLDVEVSPLNRQSWMGTRFPYWEGPVRVTGSHAGRGYLEMTGYE